MKDVIQVSNGDRWREVQTLEEAMRIGQETKTAFGHFYKGDVKGAQPARYFALGDDFKVIGSVPITTNPKGRPDIGMPLFVTHMNGNPFRDYAPQIEELAQAIGIEITREHYPYRGLDEDCPSP